MEEKRQRLERLMGTTHVTNSALARVMTQLETRPEPAASRYVLQDVAKKCYDKMGTSIDLAYSDGSGTFKWEIIRIDRAFQHFAERCPAFRDALLHATSSATSPLKLAFYCDEVTPGDPLVLDVTRKFWTFYVSIFDFSLRRLCSEYFWLPLAVIRTSVAKLVVGGVSGCMAEFLKSVFGEPGGFFSRFRREVAGAHSYLRAVLHVFGRR